MEMSVGAIQHVAERTYHQYILIYNTHQHLHQLSIHWLLSLTYIILGIPAKKVRLWLVNLRPFTSHHVLTLTKVCVAKCIQAIWNVGFVSVTYFLVNQSFVSSFASIVCSFCIVSVSSLAGCA